MNPQSDSTPGLRLPQPSINPGPVQQFASSPLQVSPQLTAHPQEQPMIHQSFAPGQPQTSAMPQQPTQSVVQPTASVSGMVNPGLTPQPMPQQPEVPKLEAVVPLEPDQPTPAVAPPAEDNDDSLDEQWIGKAKNILDQYKADPYMQSKAFSKLKADYMQTRHNKTLKVEE